MHDFLGFEILQSVLWIILGSKIFCLGLYFPIGNIESPMQNVVGFENPKMLEKSILGSIIFCLGLYFPIRIIKSPMLF